MVQRLTAKVEFSAPLDNKGFLVEYLHYKELARDFKKYARHADNCTYRERAITVGRANAVASDSACSCSCGLSEVLERLCDD